MKGRSMTQRAILRLSPDAPITYGAVYFRKSNPPREDWARDYQTAARDGMNAFRHWFLWSAIEVAPGVYDWGDYDRQLDLAAETGLKTVIAEMITIAPEWAYRKYAHGQLETRDGRKQESRMQGSCVAGGAPGLCLDNEDVRQAAERFLRALVTRYRDHPGLGGYDIWNECTVWQDVCYCPATAERFRGWLVEKYGDLRKLGEAWHRYSYAGWEDVMPPRHLGGYPDVLDWLQFRVDNAYRLMRWRADTIRSLDDAHPVTAHGIAGTLTHAAPSAADDWRAADEVESYGFTWVACRKGDEPWKHLHAVDLARAAARGKPFWHAEAQGGPLWMQPQVIGRPREDGRIPAGYRQPVATDVRYWHLVSLMGGATGILYPRWRPLLDGPLFGAFGPYAMDGSRTPRSEMAGRIARWANAPEQAPLWQSGPVCGEVGIVYVPETQQFIYAQQGSTDLYAQSMWGAYRGLLALNVQADWVHVEHMRVGATDDYGVLYLPCPVMLSQRTADRLRGWVAAGGTLIAEGCPAYFGEGGHVGTVQPNLGLDEVLGARESYVEFTPDLLGELRFTVDGARAWGGWCLQAFEPTTGRAVGWYEDGRVAAVDHVYGKGKTRLIGTMAGVGYGAHSTDRVGDLFAGILAYASVERHVSCSDPQIMARIHGGPGGTYLWVANPTRREHFVHLELGSVWGPYSRAHALWGAEAQVEGRTVALTVEGRDVAVIALE
jgi:beta-galactosidase